MIRVVQTFTCEHEKPAQPFIVKTMGHTVVQENRECLCTGFPTAMKRKVAYSDPDAGVPH